MYTSTPGPRQSSVSPVRAVAAGLFLAISSSQAQPVELADLSLEQLMDVRIASVVGASKYEQKITRAAASVTILDRDDIQRFGARNPAELLRGVRGVYVSDDRNYSYLGMRGFLRPGDYNTRTLMLLDGHRMNEAIFDSFHPDQTALLDLGLIERVELVRGPSSSVYGSNAFFGVINLVPRRGADLKGTAVAIDGGSLGTWQGRASYGTQWGRDGDLVVSTSFFERSGNRRLYFPEFDPRVSDDPRADNEGWADNFDGERASQVYLSASHGDLRLTVFGSSRTREVPTASFITAFNAAREKTRDDRGFIDLRLEREVADATHLTVRAYFDGYRYLGTYPYSAEDDASPDALLLNYDQTYALWGGLESHLVRRLSGGHTLLVGAEYRNNLRQDLFNYDQSDEREYYVNARNKSATHAVFAETEFQVTSRLLLMSGLRYGAGTAHGGSSVHPRVAAILTPWTGAAAKLLYGSAYRAPNAYERDYLESDDELRSERIRTYEAVFEQYWDHGLRGSVSAYAYEVIDLISVIGSDDDIFQRAENSLRTEARGFEFEFEARTSRGALLRTSLALQRSREKATREELTHSPRRLFKAHLLVPLRGDLTTGLEVQYNSDVRALNGEQLPSFWLTNLTLFHGDVRPHLTLSATVYNLFDTSYAYPGSADHLQPSLVQDGRTFRLKFEYRF